LGLHVSVVGGLDVVEYIDVEGASCPGNRRIIYFHKILQNIL
jgi:hypothetical protein